MNIFGLLAKHFWIMFIVVTCANALIMKRRSKVKIEKDPSLKEGYDKIFKGFITWGNIPWIIMGAGIVTGSVPTIFHYFRPTDGNPYVIAFFISVFIIWILGTCWLFLKNGADMLVKHPGIFKFDFSSPAMVKLFWFLCLASSIAGAALLFTIRTPLPNFR